MSQATELVGIQVPAALLPPEPLAPPAERRRHTGIFGMGVTRPISAALLASVLAACGNSSPPPAQTDGSTATVRPDAQQPEDRSQLPFVGKVWIATMPGSALGSMLIFLPDGTLVMDSCFEAYRLSQWGMAGDHVRWLEDTIPIEAEVSVRFNKAMHLRIGNRERVYIAASVPYTCPDMPR